MKMRPWDEYFLYPFRLEAPQPQKVAVVLNAPHSGNIYPSPFLEASKLTSLALRGSEDAFVDQLFAQGPALGAPLLAARFPRAFIDVNREPWELDPEMFDDRLPTHANTNSIRVAAGLGTIPRLISEDIEIYKEKLPIAEVEARLTKLYFPYHEALENLVQQTHAQFGASLLLDCHSMPESAASAGLSETRFRPDIVLGDRHGSACSRNIIELLQNLLEAEGLRVTRNRPYAGGHITRLHGKPHFGRHAIQIEICRSLYMNEETITPHAGFSSLKASLSHVLQQLFCQIPEIIEQKPLAAE